MSPLHTITSPLSPCLARPPYITAALPRVTRDPLLLSQHSLSCTHPGAAPPHPSPFTQPFARSTLTPTHVAPERPLPPERTLTLSSLAILAFMCHFWPARPLSLLPHLGLHSKGWLLPPLLLSSTLCHPLLLLRLPCHSALHSPAASVLAEFSACAAEAMCAGPLCLRSAPQPADPPPALLFFPRQGVVDPWLHPCM